MTMLRVGDPVEVAKLRVQGPPVPLASAQLFEGVVASPKIRVPTVKLAPRLTVRAALMSSVLKSAMASMPVATTPPLQFEVVLHGELDEALIHVPSVAREERTAMEKTRASQTTVEAERDVRRRRMNEGKWEGMARGKRVPAPATAGVFEGEDGFPPRGGCAV